MKPAPAPGPVPSVRTPTDQREYARQVSPMRDRLFAAAMKLTRDRDEADDLVQDVMLRAFRFWGSYQQGTSLNAWLFTILRNTYINGYHRQGRAQAFQSDVASQMHALGPVAAVANSNSEPPGPEDAAIAREARERTRKRIREALAMLPTDYRIAVAYADLEGLSYREIAALMECPIGTVMSRIHRGRKILRRLLRDTMAP